MDKKEEKTEEAQKPDCAKTCQYYTRGSSLHVLRRGFCAVIFICIAAVAAYYLYANRALESRYASITKQHNDFCEHVLQITHFDLAKDSALVVDNSILHAIKEETHTLDHKFELLSLQLKDEQSTLTLWASVLMIIFLVFSIYAMYKIDEMQKQAHDSVGKIRDIHQQSVIELSKLDSEVETKFDGYKKEVDERVKKWLEAAESFKEKINTDIEIKKEQFDGSLTNSQDLLNRLSVSVNDLLQKTITNKELLQQQEKKLDNVYEERINQLEKDIESDRTRLKNLIEEYITANEIQKPENDPEPQVQPAELEPDSQQPANYGNALEEINKKVDTPADKSITELSGDENSDDKNSADENSDSDK